MRILNKEKELLRISKKPVRRMVQYDCFLLSENEADSVMQADKDGDCLFVSISEEFRNSDCLRVQFLPDMSVEDVTRGLRKIISWIEKEGVVKADEGVKTCISCDRIVFAKNKCLECVVHEGQSELRAQT